MPEPVEVAEIVSENAKIKNDTAVVENTEDADVLLAKGKRDLVCGEVQKAVNQLQEACRLQAKKHGEMADACAESYYQYGVALLELSRMESGVLGNALQGITTQEAGEAEEKESEEDKEFTEPDNFTEAEKEKISEEVIDAMLEQNDKPSQESTESSSAEKPAESASAVEQPAAADEPSAAKTSEESQTSETEEKIEVDEPVKKQKQESSEASATADKDESAENKPEESSEEKKEGESEEGEAMEEENGGEEGEEDAEEDIEETTDVAEKSVATEDEEDVSNLQIAWEMLELAKNIYKTHESTEMKLKHAECLLKLGEIGIESEHYKQAVEDIKECLRLQVESGLSASDRRLAETHYQLGLAHYHSTGFSDAVLNFRKAIDIIQARVAELREESKGLKKSSEESKEATSNGDGEGASNGDVGVNGEEKSCGEGDKLKQLEDEINDLEALIPDIMNKIEDAEEDLRNGDKVKAMVLETETAAESTSELSSEPVQDDKPVTSVGHLVRRKRKPDEDEESTEVSAGNEDVKKLKPDSEAEASTETTAAASTETTAAASTETTVAASTETTAACGTKEAAVAETSETEAPREAVEAPVESAKGSSVDGPCEEKMEEQTESSTEVNTAGSGDAAAESIEASEKPATEQPASNNPEQAGSGDAVEEKMSVDPVTEEPASAPAAAE